MSSSDKRHKHQIIGVSPPSAGDTGRPSGPEGPALCRVSDCGRPSYARGLCQTHHRQMLTRGRVKPIRPYRKRAAGTVKFAGLRLTPQCAQRIREYADREGVSLGAAIAFILEEWLVKKK